MSPEMTVLESVHCPTCSAHYGLKASRVRSGIRRALCFRCSTIFSIEREVQRLTAQAGPVAEEVGIGPEDLLDLAPEKEEAAAPVLEEASTPTLEEVAAPAPSLEDLTPSLTLGDLEGAEEEILEKTLVVEGEQVHPETPTEEGREASEFDATTGGYTSAKDAIAKLLGGLPPVEARQERRSAGRSATQMDVEATLNALDSTLGGVGVKGTGTEPLPPAEPEAPRPEGEPSRSTSSTMKLTHDEIASAMKAASVPVPAPVVHPPAPVSRPAAAQPLPEADTTLLKLQVGQEVYSNVSMEQLTTWIEQGRVQDFHMVARQFSENWIEAGKIPSLRPVFDRIRRQQAPAGQQAQASATSQQAAATPAKRGLFGSLFHRG